VQVMSPPRFQKAIPLLVTASLTVLPGCTGQYANKPYCEACADAALVGTAAVAAALKPTTAVSRALARGPTPLLSEGDPHDVVLTATFESGTSLTRAYWIGPDAIFLAGLSKSGRVTRLVKPDGTPVAGNLPEPFGSIVGSTDDGLLLALPAPEEPGHGTGTILKLLDSRRFQLHPMGAIGCSPIPYALSADGSRLWCRTPEAIVAFDTRTRRETGRIPKGEGPGIADMYQAVALGNAGEVVVGTDRGKLSLYPSGSTTAPMTVAELKNSAIRTLQYLPRPNAIAVRTEDTDGIVHHGTGRVVIIDLSTGVERQLMSTDTGDYHVEFSANGDGTRLVVVKSHDAELFDVHSGNLIARIGTGENYSISAQLNKSGDRLLVTAGPKVAVYKIAPSNVVASAAPIAPTRPAAVPSRPQSSLPAL